MEDRQERILDAFNNIGLKGEQIKDYNTILGEKLEELTSLMNREKTTIQDFTFKAEDLLRNINSYVSLTYSINDLVCEINEEILKVNDDLKMI